MASCRNFYKISRGSVVNSNIRVRVLSNNARKDLIITSNKSFGFHNSAAASSSTKSIFDQKAKCNNGNIRKYHHFQRTVDPISRKKFGRHYSSYPTHEVVKLPNLSPTMEVGTIVSWEKAEGDRVEEGEVLAIIETDKSTMEMETPDEGYVAKIIAPAGSKDIPVNQQIAIIVFDEEDIKAFENYVPDDSPQAPQEAAETSSPTPPTSSAPSPPQSAQAPTPAAPPPPVERTPTASQTARIFASPLAKRTALAMGININEVGGTGPRGRITIEDVEGFKGAQPAAPPPIVSPPAAPSTAAVPSDRSYTDIDLSNMRKTIAKRLAESKQTVPHYYLTVDVNMGSILELRQELNNNSDGLKLSVNDFIIKASALSLKKVPQCNSQWMNDFIREFHNVDVSVAVSTETGLITPIVFDADKKGLHGINIDVVSLAEKSRNKTIQPHEFMGGTFTISNLGMFGIDNFSAVINPPQSCILAVGATTERLMPDATTEQGFSVAKMMSVTLSCDHRVVDGAVGAQWLKAFRSYLENPMTMLL